MTVVEMTFCAAQMEQLPLEIVDTVSQFLPVHDVLSLCSTNARFYSCLSLFLRGRDIHVADYNAAVRLLQLGCRRLHVDLRQTRLLDASKLGGAYELDLSYTKVVDVSMLGGVHTLNLSDTEVVDVSMLGSVHLPGSKVYTVSSVSQ